jgi:hypothetical protein
LGPNHAPPVTREWPAGPPAPRAIEWPPVLLAAAVIAIVLLLIQGALVDAFSDPLNTHQYHATRHASDPRPHLSVYAYPQTRPDDPQNR